MLTKIMPIDESALALSENIIRDGGVVAFPTETVYGLGADALNQSAVEQLYRIKGRPADNPLIVHVHKDYNIETLVKDIPEYAKLLAEAFLPGPLTMVYKSRGIVCNAVSCGLDTLAIRIPSHSGAQSFLKYVNKPIAAPSANISKHVSPVTARHVYDDLNGKIELILDGGKCSGGIESTVIDCTGEIPCILRSGLVTKEMIAQVAGECDEYVLKSGEKVRSPGMKYKHYAPKCKTALFDCGACDEAIELYKQKLLQGEKAYVLCEDYIVKQYKIDNALNLGSTEEQIASNLYDKLREGEMMADIIIAIAPRKQDGVMVGVMNRLKKACAGYET